ncbi:hypothetical protein [Corynebacterium sp. NML140438]|uniref:hypothetical protein n=1 Tax=Corynebacterium sp. NML140438 TaxID=1906334 RepID=UPI00210070D1|nr:hypothetical protein [Corynebacterium sp. NML140438]
MKNDFTLQKGWTSPLKKLVSRFVPVVAMVAAALTGVVTVNAPAYAAESASATAPVSSGQNDRGDLWFEQEDGIRSFNVDSNVLVPNVLDGDQIKIEGNLINTYDAQGKLVASIKADLPEGVVLKYTDGVIYAGSVSGQAARCIDNKWVSLGINLAADALVCAPFGAATGGVGGFGCSAAVGVGITAASC